VLEADALIVGAGPAGCAAAINLAPLRQVLLVERRAEVTPRVGESLVPAARRLLTDMGLWESFIAEGHEPWYGNRAVWGAPEPLEVDFMRDPDGHGWHLDRARFEQWLRAHATKRGAGFIAPASVDHLAHDGERWQVQLNTPASQCTANVKLIIEAGGRAAPVARKQGARVQASDRLICAWVSGRDARESNRGLTYVEAVEDGWWYTAPVPGRQRILAFYTDADLPNARVINKRDGLLERAASAEELSALLTAAGFVPEAQSHVTAAHSAMLDPCAEESWLAVGDAAISFDPLSSQGLLNALFTGLAAANAADRYLEGDAHSLSVYRQVVRGIGDAYRQHLASFYATEQRWPEAQFWRRRRA
jgi:flavin-dependent dehydrogenase